MKTAPIKKKSARTRQFIIEKSASLFNKKGLVGTSIADIMKATGLTKGSIYGNFKDKEEVAMEVFEYNVYNMLGELYEKLHLQSSAIEKLIQYPRYFKQCYEKVFNNGGCAILNTSVEVDDTHPDFKILVANTIKNWENSLIKIIEEGKQHSEIHSTVDSSKYASLFIATFEGGVMLSKATEDPKYIHYSLDHWEAIIHQDLKINQN